MSAGLTGGEGEDQRKFDILSKVKKLVSANFIRELSRLNVGEGLTLTPPERLKPSEGVARCKRALISRRNTKRRAKVGFILSLNREVLGF